MEVNDRFSKGRSDRIGSKIFYHLLAYSYCLNNNYNFLGTISCKKGKSAEKKKTFIIYERMCQFLGIPQLVPLFSDNNEYDDYLKENNKHYIESKHYLKDNTENFTTDFLSKIRNNVKYLPKNKDVLRVVIHIRRGDVNPKDHPKRYLDNKFYLDKIKVIEKICGDLNKKIKIIIYSEERSCESLDIFKRYDLRIGSSKWSGDIEEIKETWKQMWSADILLISKSYFSLVPAIYNKNIVLCMPINQSKTTHKKMNYWIDMTDSDYKKQLENKIRLSY